MKNKIKDGVRLNLYVDRSIIQLLDKIAANKLTSRSQAVEQIVRAYESAQKSAQNHTQDERPPPAIALPPHVVTITMAPTSHNTQQPKQTPP